LGVTEGAVRYHLRRDGVPDGRGDKPQEATRLQLRNSQSAVPEAEQRLATPEESS